MSSTQQWYQSPHADNGLKLQSNKDLVTVLPSFGDDPGSLCIPMALEHP